VWAKPKSTLAESGVTFGGQSVQTANWSISG
jgi:hypothetical protein